MLPVTHLLVDTRMLTRQLQCVLGPEINYKPTCDTHCVGISMMFKFVAHSPVVAPPIHRHLYLSTSGHTHLNDGSLHEAMHSFNHTQLIGSDILARSCYR